MGQIEKNLVTLGQTEQFPRPILGQTEQTQVRPWADRAGKRPPQVQTKQTLCVKNGDLLKRVEKVHFLSLKNAQRRSFPLKKLKNCLLKITVRNADFLVFKNAQKLSLPMPKNRSSRSKKHKGSDRFSLKTPIKNGHFSCFLTKFQQGLSPEKNGYSCQLLIS